jgi:hypothetical protein
MTVNLLALGMLGIFYLGMIHPLKETKETAF